MSSTRMMAASHFILGGLVASTILVGIAARFTIEPGLARYWITPLCLLTCMGALVTGKLRQRVSQPGRDQKG